MGREIEFVHAPNHWGNEVLKPEEMAIIFLSSISGQLYEAASRGHMLLEQIDGQVYAIYPSRELWLDDSTPDILKNYCRQDSFRKNSTAIQFDVIENYLIDAIETKHTAINDL